MTIDEAIAHAREVASEQKRRSGICVQNNSECDKFSACLKCSEEHEQLAEWLKELKDLRELKDTITSNAEVLEMQGYNKAIDDFVIAIICELKNKHTDMPIVDIFGNREKWREKNSQYLEFENLAYKIAEQLKAGVKE